MNDYDIRKADYDEQQNYRYIFIECSEGRYGVNCSQECSGQCKDNIICEHVTGQCVKGCDVGWTGATCDKGLNI